MFSIINKWKKIIRKVKRNRENNLDSYERNRFLNVSVVVLALVMSTVVMSASVISAASGPLVSYPQL